MIIVLAFASYLLFWGSVALLSVGELAWGVEMMSCSGILCGCMVLLLEEQDDDLRHLR